MMKRSEMVAELLALAASAWISDLAHDYFGEDPMPDDMPDEEAAVEMANNDVESANHMALAAIRDWQRGSRNLKQQEGGQ